MSDKPITKEMLENITIMREMIEDEWGDQGEEDKRIYDAIRALILDYPRLMAIVSAARLVTTRISAPCADDLTEYKIYGAKDSLKRAIDEYENEKKIRDFGEEVGRKK